VGKCPALRSIGSRIIVIVESGAHEKISKTRRVLYSASLVRAYPGNSSRVRKEPIIRLRDRFQVSIFRIETWKGSGECRLGGGGWGGGGGGGVGGGAQLVEREPVTDLRKRNSYLSNCPSSLGISGERRGIGLMSILC